MACDTDYESPSGETYTLPEDIPIGHVTLKGPMTPKEKQNNVYDYFFDIKDCKFKLWDTLVDTSPISADVEVLLLLVSDCMLCHSVRVFLLVMMVLQITFSSGIPTWCRCGHLTVNDEP